MSDVLIRGIFPRTGLRFVYCDGTELCNESIRRHHADPISGWLLSEALVAAAMLSTSLKFEERLTLRWLYSGPIGTIITDVNEEAQVRGFTQRLTLLPDVTTVGAAIGRDGRISAVTSLPNRIGRTGITAAVFRDVCMDLAYFLSLSYQVESALAVGIDMPPLHPPVVKFSRGIFLQPLPDAQLERFDATRNVMESPPFRAWMQEAPRSLHEILARLDVGEAPQELLEQTPAYKCNCSKEKVESVLRTLDPREIQEMLDQEGMAQVSCHFCAETYYFSASDLQSILDNSLAGTA